MAVTKTIHVEIWAGSRFVGRLEAPKYMTMGPWIQGLPISSIDQTDIEWMLENASRAAPTDR
jgi:hypothetical protein